MGYWIVMRECSMVLKCYSKSGVGECGFSCLVGSRCDGNILLCI